MPVGVLLSGGLDSSLIVALLAEAGQQHLRTFSIGFDSRDGESGDEFHYSDLVARAYDTDHQRIRLADDDLVPAVRRAVLAMTEPMGSHDVVAFHLLSEQVAQHVKVAQSGQGADEVFAGYGYHQPLVEAPRHGAARDVRRRVLRPRPRRAAPGIVGPAYALEHDASRELLTAHLAAPGAQTALDAVLRLDTHLMLPDDPVKRVDSMSMAWGLEVRTPVPRPGPGHPRRALPAGAQGRPGRQGRAQGGRPAGAAGRGDRPAARATSRCRRCATWTARCATWSPRRCRRRPRASGGCSARSTWRQLLAEPDRAEAAAGSNKLWQLGLLELWLQTHGIR